MESIFRQKQREEQETVASSGAKTEVEFATPEEAITADRAQTVPPPEIAERLNESLAAEPKRGTSLWTKLGFKKS
jgi:hypothetical protein